MTCYFVGYCVRTLFGIIIINGVEIVWDNSPEDAIQQKKKELYKTLPWYWRNILLNCEGRFWEVYK